MTEPRPLSDFADNFSLGYPHANSFADGGRTILLGRRTEEEASLWKFDVSAWRGEELCRFRKADQPEKQLWSDTAWRANFTVTVADNAVWILPQTLGDDLRMIYKAPEGKWLHPLPSVREDGSLIVVGLYGPGVYAALAIEPGTSHSRVLFEKDWWIDHFHFCPFDPSWLGFSHEGDCSQVMDRAWGWHAEEAPEGRVVFDQRADREETTLYAGHERWSFHDRSVLVVAYGAGPGAPRGIYEAFVDGRPQKLLSEGNRDLHLDVSRDGRWVAIDTSGPHDLPGKGWEDAGKIGDILVLDRATGERRFVARSRLSSHPSHPHPVFTPDGAWLFFNEADETGTLNRVWRAANPFLDGLAL